MKPAHVIEQISEQDRTLRREELVASGFELLHPHARVKDNILGVEHRHYTIHTFANFPVAHVLAPAGLELYDGLCDERERIHSLYSLPAGKDEPAILSFLDTQEVNDPGDLVLEFFPYLSIQATKAWFLRSTKGVLTLDNSIIRASLRDTYTYNALRHEHPYLRYATVEATHARHMQ